MIPIFHYVSIYMFDPARITGMSAHPRTKQNLFLIDVLGDGVGADEARPMKARAHTGIETDAPAGGTP